MIHLTKILGEIMKNEEKPKQSQVNVFHYVAYTILIAALGALGYFYADLNSQSFQEKDSVKKIANFEDLPLDVQKEYKSLSEYKSLEMRLENVQEQNELLVAMDKNEKPDFQTEVVTEKNAEALEEIPKDAKLIKEFASCYDMEMGSYIISWKCKKNIISFIDKHKDASYFEIISLVDDSEFSLYKNLQNNDFIYDKLGVTQKSIDKMKKLSQSGLAKHRAVEANWVIKAHTNRKAKVYSANYHLISHDAKRGVLVRAYH